MSDYQEIAQILQNAQNDIAQADSVQLIEQVRVAYLGKKGHLTQQLKQLNNLPADQRPVAGQAINEAKRQVAQLLQARQSELAEQALQHQLAKETIDITLPGIGIETGGLHPLTIVQRRMQTIFTRWGFSIAYGPEIENDYYNFTALNTPEHHPARAMQDTFYFPDGHLLRSHTSPVQVRVLENQPLPVSVIAPGRVYRCDRDMTHSPMFHQLEGLVVNETASFAQLKSLVKNFLTAFFARDDIEVRFRASYFPFTEPSAEVDIRVAGEDKWLEVLGCGMVHPNVLTQAGIDNERYTGFAFGIGIERFAMLYYGVRDLRWFFANDLNFLQQFN